MVKLGPLVRRYSCTDVRGMVDKLTTPLFLLPNAVCTGTDALANMDVVVGVVGAVGEVGAVVVIQAMQLHLVSTVPCGGPSLFTLIVP